LSKLKNLTKKGDLSDPNNRRPLMLLDVLQKIKRSLVICLVDRGTTDKNNFDAFQLSRIC